MEINGRGQLQLWEVLLLSLPPMDFAHSVTASRFAQWEPLAAKAVGGGKELRLLRSMSSGDPTQKSSFTFLFPWLPLGFAPQ